MGGNVGTQVPHPALRTYVMGDRGSDQSELPTKNESASPFGDFGEYVAEQSKFAVHGLSMFD